ncbi:hypothetical protein SSX86_013764 [Deinandra increscens subsp. villosa]|uniref:High-affinity nitrate transporter n=1 Tax=Deinandra increscens subsp. villosa TaxID=3103831 RepID=A0AAP0D553_9ASTR
MEVSAGFQVVSLLLFCFAATSHGVYFSSLKETLEVIASPTNGQVLKAGEDNITVTWGFNQTWPAGTDSDYKTIKVKLCYAPISQKDRKWRKTEDHLKKDKTCSHKIVARPYAASNNSFTWTVERDIPSATYFVRAFAFNAQEEEVAYGQTTDAHKSTNLFKVQAITGRHVSLDIASVCFSAFSVVTLAGFFYKEKRNSDDNKKISTVIGYLDSIAATSHGVSFSSLKETLEVIASPTNGQVLKAGEDNITVTWRFNQTLSAGTDSDYKTIKVKLCYAPISQKDRKWRKTEDLLKKDKSCTHKIVAGPYAASNNSFTWTVKRDIPSATYFVRAYALNAQEEEVAYGQTTNAQKSTNLFEVQAITGRHASLDIASICFSAFSVVSLAGFFYMEKRK